MINSQILNLFQLITSLLPQTATVPESSNTSFISLMLLILLLGSLVLTFHSKGTTVHKVLGLLLVSIFVVFIWALQTQFLFIYIVYILAFISAVLMLFLSVVLMLPISTLTTKNFKNAPLLLVQYTQYSNYEFNSFTLAIALILSTVFILWVIYPFHTHISEISKYYDDAYYSVIRPTNQTVLDRIKFFFGGYKPLNSTFANYCVKLAYNMFKAFIMILGLTLSYLSEVRDEVRTSIYTFFELLINSRQTLVDNFKQLIDMILQSYLFISVVLGLFASFINKQFQPALQAAELSPELHQGIGQLKTLLYGDFSLFLIFSTVVLLVALLGAAVMTRSKR